MSTDLVFKLLISGWITFKLFWFITDPKPLKNRLKLPLTKKTIQLYSITLLTIIPQVMVAWYFPSPLTMFDDFLQIFGMIVFYTGLLLACWAKWTMKKNWGMPAQHDIKKQNELVTDGPYKISRNPIYVGLLFMCLGFAIALRSYLFFLVILLYLFFRHVIIIEEKLLMKYFGNIYSKYKKAVPRFM